MWKTGLLCTNVFFDLPSFFLPAFLSVSPAVGRSPSLPVPSHTGSRRFLRPHARCAAWAIPRPRPVPVPGIYILRAPGPRDTLSLIRTLTLALALSSSFFRAFDYAVFFLNRLFRWTIRKGPSSCFLDFPARLIVRSSARTVGRSFWTNFATGCTRVTPRTSFLRSLRYDAPLCRTDFRFRFFGETRRRSGSTPDALYDRASQPGCLQPGFPDIEGLDGLLAGLLGQPPPFFPF